MEAGLEETVASMFLDASARKMREMARTTETCLGKLEEEDVWRRGAEHENTIGNLLLHLCGNIRQWIHYGVCGEAYQRKRDEEFSTSGGASKAELLAGFRETVESAAKAVAGLDPARLTERIDPQGLGATPVLEAIYKVVGHLQLHVGQIVVLTKQMYGRDLDLSLPRKR